MMRLSTADTRRCWCALDAGVCVVGLADWRAGALNDAGDGTVARLPARLPSKSFCDEGLTSSSQVSIGIPVSELWKQCFKMKSTEALLRRDLLLLYTDGRSKSMRDLGDERCY